MSDAKSAADTGHKSKSASEIRRLRDANPEMRARDFARVHQISEAELVVADIAEDVTRLDIDVPAMLDELPSFGEVMALTRNESAVHEKIGPYENIKNGGHASLVLGEQIDLRIFPNKWAHAFSVQKMAKDGELKRSLQFFDAAGDAVHKVHLRPDSNLYAYNAFVTRFAAEDQSAEIEIKPRAAKKALPEPGPDMPDTLRNEWSKMTDTHQFIGILRRLKLSRRQAMHMIDRDFAWRLDLAGVQQMFESAAATALPIMAFVGNDACIQIHSGPVHEIKTMGPWLNVMDPTFHLHLRQDHITELWAVRKPTKDGHVTSLEAYGADGELIIQFFGKRHEGNEERTEWRALVESLQADDQVSAA